MKPDLEVVDVLQHESFKVWGHGYPFRTVRWHFHPEYEIQLITETSGQYFVGDFVGRFAPGNLVLMAPNLPHNWVSELPEGSTVDRRNLILQFSQEFLTERVLAFPEMRYLDKMIASAKRGLVFSNAIGSAARPLLEELLTATGGRPLGIVPNILLVPSSLEAAADRVVNVKTLPNGGDNPNYGKAKVIVMDWV